MRPEGIEAQCPRRAGCAGRDLHGTSRRKNGRIQPALRAPETSADDTHVHRNASETSGKEELQGHAQPPADGLRDGGQARRRTSPSGWRSGRQEHLYEQLHGGPREQPQGQVGPARRPAVRQRRHPHRPRDQQDAEGRGPSGSARCRGIRRRTCPGWDCHGLPIEHKIQEEIKKDKKDFREMPVVDVRRRCYEYAAKYVDVQSEQFQRLGILGEWDRPYLTMEPRVRGVHARGLRQVRRGGAGLQAAQAGPWSVANQTALADAELEYQDVDDPSVYVEFPVANPGRRRHGRQPATVHRLDDDAVDAAGEPGDRGACRTASTPSWTTPATATAGPGSSPQDLVDRVFKDRNGVTSYTVVDVRKAATSSAWIPPPVVERTEGTAASVRGVADGHEVLDRASTSTTDGRHGPGPHRPRPRRGRLPHRHQQRAGGLQPRPGQRPVRRHRPRMIQRQDRVGRQPADHRRAQRPRRAVRRAERSRHSYPHDWRSKTPIIFRATEQWFVAMDKPFARRSEPEGTTTACASGRIEACSEPT